MKHNFITFNSLVLLLAVLIGTIVNPDYKNLLIINKTIKNPNPHIDIEPQKKKKDNRAAKQIPEEERDYYLERLYPAFGNLVPRDVASRRAKEMGDKGYAVWKTQLAVYLDLQDIIQREGKEWVKEKYGNHYVHNEKSRCDRIVKVRWTFWWVFKNWPKRHLNSIKFRVEHM